MRKRSIRFTAIALSMLMAFGDCGSALAAEINEQAVDNVEEQTTSLEDNSDSSEENESSDNPQPENENSDTDSDSEQEPAAIGDETDSDTVEESSADSDGETESVDDSDAITDNAENTESEAPEEEDTESEEETDDSDAEEKEEQSEESSEENSKETEEKRIISDELEQKLDLYVYGSDGIEHEGVDYITYRAFLNLDENARDEYIQMCDEAAEVLGLGIGVDEIVISSDMDGNLDMGYFINFEELAEAMVTYEVPDSANESDDSEDSTEAISEETIADDTTEINDDTVNEDGSAEETTETRIIEIQSFDDLSDEEKATLGLDRFVEENTDELAEVLVDEEQIELVEDEPLDFEIDLSETTENEGDETQMTALDSSLSVYNQNYFYDQLTTDEKAVFDYGKKSLLNGINSFSFYSSYISTTSICNALSAMMTTYSSSFGWVDKSSSGGFSVSRQYCCNSTKPGNYTVTISKSKYYNSALASQANSKINAVVKEAYNFAKTYYPNKPTYGMVYYFDEWLCENNYYNNAGTSGCGSNKDSSTYYYCHTMYGCLLKGYGVCESYATAMSALLDKAGITNIYVIGYFHAWNYVYMPDNKWYLQDTTYNDGTSLSHNYSSRGYLLRRKDSRTESGGFYCSGKDFKFPAVSTTDYSLGSANEALRLNKTRLILKPKGTAKLSINKYYANYSKTWKSSNTRVAKVSKNGKVTACNPGVATISITIAGKTESCTVYVYKVTSLKFSNNNSTKYSMLYQNQDRVLDSSDISTIALHINQAGAYDTAQNLIAQYGVGAPSVKSSNSKTVKITNVRIVDNDLLFDIVPLKLGKAKITIKFGGKKAYLTVNVKQVIQDDWFELSYTEKGYNGKALKPKIKKTAMAFKKAEYKVKYINNKKRGTATVTIKGSGKYTGTVTKTFTIY